MTHVQTISPVRRLFNDLVATNFATLKPTSARALRASCVGTLRTAGAVAVATSLDESGPAIPTLEWFEAAKGHLADLLAAEDRLAMPVTNPLKQLVDAAPGCELVVETPAAKPARAKRAAKATKAADEPAPVTDSISAAAAAVAAEPVAVATAAVEPAAAAALPEKPAAPVPAPVASATAEVAPAGSYELPKWVKPAQIEDALKDGVDLRKATGNVQLQVAIALLNMASTRDALSKLGAIELPEGAAEKIAAAQAELRSIALAALTAKSRTAPRTVGTPKAEVKPLAVGGTIRLSKTGMKDALIVDTVGSADATGTVTRVVLNDAREVVRVSATFAGVNVVLRARDVVAV